MDFEEASKVVFETESKNFYRGYNYGNVEFYRWCYD